MTATDVSRPPVVMPGEFVTVAMKIGEMEIETVARAMDGAAAGEIIRAKNEANGDMYRVVITGPNAGRVAQSEADDVATLPHN